MSNRCVLCNYKSTVIIYCKFCENNFCLKHRLPEVHNCKNIHILCKKEYDKNSEKLLSEGIRSKRIEI
jgi:predicted nucleic acid binding AN1-type Zn finger protein